MEPLNMDQVKKIQEGITKHVQEVISSYLQSYTSESLHCSEKDMAMACQLVRQKHRDRVHISYEAMNRANTQFSYYIKNKTLH